MPTSSEGSEGKLFNISWYFKPGSHMPVACLRHACDCIIMPETTCRQNTGKVELKSTFPACRRYNCGTGGNRRTNVHIIYVLKLPSASSLVRRRHICEPGFTCLYKCDCVTFLISGLSVSRPMSSFKMSRLRHIMHAHYRSCLAQCLASKCHV